MLSVEIQCWLIFARASYIVDLCFILEVVERNRISDVCFSCLGWDLKSTPSDLRLRISSGEYRVAQSNSNHRRAAGMRQRIPGDEMR